jgi:hypothetical protein
MIQIIDLLGDEKKNTSKPTGLMSFGIFKFLVVPFLKDLNEMRKAYFKKETPQKRKINQWPHHLHNHRIQLQTC